MSQAVLPVYISLSAVTLNTVLVSFAKWCCIFVLPCVNQCAVPVSDHELHRLIEII